MSTDNCSIVFIHGLMGDRWKTWNAKPGLFWPLHYLPLDIPSARVMVWGYDADLAPPNPLHMVSTNGITSYAKALCTDLAGKRIEDHTSTVCQEVIPV